MDFNCDSPESPVAIMCEEINSLMYPMLRGLLRFSFRNVKTKKMIEKIYRLKSRNNPDIITKIAPATKVRLIPEEMFLIFSEKGPAALDAYEVNIYKKK